MDYIVKGFLTELEKLAEEGSYTSVSKGDKGAKAPGTGLGVSTRSPWYREKRKAPPARDLGKDLNRTSVNFKV